MNWFTKHIEVIQSRPATFGIELEKISHWPLEAVFLFGRICEAKKRHHVIEAFTSEAESGYRSAEKNWSDFGMYEDCGPSYEAELERARAMITFSKESPVVYNNFVGLVKYFEATQTPYRKEMHSLLKEQNRAYRELVNKKEELIVAASRFTRTLCGSHIDTSLKKHLTLPTWVQPHLLKVMNIGCSENAEGAYSYNRNLISANNVALFLFENGELSPQLFKEILSGKENEVSIEQAQKVYDKLVSRAKLVTELSEEVFAK